MDRGRCRKADVGCAGTRSRKTSRACISPGAWNHGAQLTASGAELGPAASNLQARARGEELDEGRRPGILGRRERNRSLSSARLAGCSRMHGKAIDVAIDVDHGEFVIAGRLAGTPCAE